MKPIFSAIVILIAVASNSASAFTFNRDSQSGQNFTQNISQDVLRIENKMAPYIEYERYQEMDWVQVPYKESYETLCGIGEKRDYPHSNICRRTREAYKSVYQMVTKHRRIEKCCKLQDIAVLDHTVDFSIDLKFPMEATLASDQIETFTGEVTNADTNPELVFKSIKGPFRYRPNIKYLGNKVFEVSFIKLRPLPNPQVYQKSLSDLRLVKNSGTFALAFKDTTPVSATAKTFFEVAIEIDRVRQSKKFDKSALKRNSAGSYIIDFQKDLGFSRQELRNMSWGQIIYASVTLSQVDSEDAGLNYEYRRTEVLLNE